AVAQLPDSGGRDLLPGHRVDLEADLGIRETTAPGWVRLVENPVDPVGQGLQRRLARAARRRLIRHADPPSAGLASTQRGLVITQPYWPSPIITLQLDDRYTS